MKRRDFLKTAGAAALAAPAVYGLSAQRAVAAQTTLRLHNFLPSVATLSKKVLKPWGENVSAATDGGLTIQHFDAMALGGRPPALMDQARDGAVDISMTVVGYTPGRFPRSEVFELPFMMPDTVATGQAYQQLIEDELQDGEFRDVKVLGGFVHGPGMIHASRPVETIDDMQGLKLRGPTRVINAMLDQLGATPVGMPLPAVPEALSKGVIDGTVIPWEVTPAIRLSELIDNHTEFSGPDALYTATIVVVMNKARYESLPDELRAQLDAQSGQALATLGSTELLAGDGPGRAIAEKAGNNIIRLDEAEVARWKAAAAPVVDDWSAEMETKGVDGAALIEKARALIAAKASS